MCCLHSIREAGRPVLILLLRFVYGYEPFCPELVCPALDWVCGVAAKGEKFCGDLHQSTKFLATMSDLDRAQVSLPLSLEAPES